MTDERGRVTMNELLVLFKDAQATHHTVRTTVFSRAVRLPSLGVRLRSARYARLRSASPPVREDGGADRQSPVLLTTSPVLFFSRRDMAFSYFLSRYSILSCFLNY